MVYKTVVIWLVKENHPSHIVNNYQHGQKVKVQEVFYGTLYVINSCCVLIRIKTVTAHILEAWSKRISSDNVKETKTMSTDYIYKLSAGKGEILIFVDKWQWKLCQNIQKACCNQYLCAPTFCSLKVSSSNYFSNNYLIIIIIRETTIKFA